MRDTVKTKSGFDACEVEAGAELSWIGSVEKLHLKRFVACIASVNLMERRSGGICKANRTRMSDKGPKPGAKGYVQEEVQCQLVLQPSLRLCQVLQSQWRPQS